MNRSLKAIGAVVWLVAACGEPRGRDTQVSAAPAAVAGREAGTGQANSPAAAGVSASVTPAPSPAPASLGLDAKLRAAFGGFEHVPDRAELLALAPEPELGPALWALWQDPTSRLAVRTNALVSLRFFPTPELQARFEQLLQDPATSAVVGRPLAKAYSYAFGAAALPLLSQLLDHVDLHTRDSAARAITATGDAKARPLLEKRLSIETEASVRQTLQRLLAVPAGGK